MGHAPDGKDDLDLLAEEIREETGRLARHPVAEVKRLEQVADEGASPATPFLLILAVTVLAAAIVAVVVTIVFVVADAG
jgi:hypothetical protein